MAPPRPASPPGLPAPAAGISPTRQLVGAGVAALGLPAVALALAGHREELLLSTPVLLMLTIVVAVAIVGGIRPALPAAVLGFLLLTVFFTEPYGTFDVHRLDQGLALVVYMATAVAVSVVVGIAARRHSQAIRAAAEAAELSFLAGAQVGAEPGLDDVLVRVREVFDLRYAAVVEQDGPDWPVVQASGELGSAEDILHLPVSSTRALCRSAARPTTSGAVAVSAR